MDKETYKYYHHLIRCKGPQHDDNFDLSDKLISLGKAKIVRVWVHEGKYCRLIEAM